MFDMWRTGRHMLLFRLRCFHLSSYLASCFLHVFIDLYPKERIVYDQDVIREKLQSRNQSSTIPYVENGQEHQGLYLIIYETYIMHLCIYGLVLICNLEKKPCRSDR